MSNKRRIKHDPDRRTAVCVAFVHAHEVDFNFFFSFWRLLGHDLQGDAKVWRGGHSIAFGGTGELAGARNAAVKAFLADDKADWLWFVDTDQGFAPDTVDRLLASADPVQRPAVGAMTFAAMQEEEDGAGGFRLLFTPVVMDWVHTDAQTGFAVRWDYPRDEVTKCDGTGSACILIHRSVFERIKEDYPDPEWASWYSRVINPATKALVSEDLSFCLRMMQAGIPLHVDTSVQTTHAKRLWLGQEDYWRQRALNPPPGWVPPEIVDRTVFRFAVVPTHNRPEQLRNLAESLNGQADWLVVLDNASEPPVVWSVLEEAFGGRVYVIADEEQPPHLSRFWNRLFDFCSANVPDEAWDVAVFNDDALAPPGWYDAVASALREGKAAAAHTGTVMRTPTASLTEAYDYPREWRLCPWGFVVKGELGLRADESMRWFYFDDDFNRQAIDAGGVLVVPGPLVPNLHANQATIQSEDLMEQTGRDREAFERKWSA